VIQFSNLVQALEAAPIDRPFVTFWVDEDEQETVTFGEFARRARVQAAALRSHGVTSGDRVIIVMPQSILAMTSFVGAIMLGAVPAFLAYPNFKIEPSKYRAGLAGVTANLSAKLVVVDEAFPEEMLGYTSLDDRSVVIRIGDQPASSGEVEFPYHKHRPEGLAFIQHSAGTTGLQKGVALTHAAVLRQIEHLSEALGIDGKDDRVYSWLPLYHDMGLIACFMLPMVCHVPIVMQSPLDWVMHPETTLQIVAEHKCTLAWMPNFAFQFIPRRTPENRRARYDLSSIRALINCSEPVRVNSMCEFESAFRPAGLKSNALQSSYAMAENVFAVTQSDPTHSSSPNRIWADGRRFRTEHLIVPVTSEAPGAVSFQSSGRVLPRNQVRIVSDSGQPVDQGHVGEILIQSDSMFEGYYNRLDLTAGAITEGWYHTGDLGFYQQDELFVIGRKKDLLIVAGENLYPQDIEDIVSSHPSIHDGRVVAMGVYNPNFGTEDIVVVAEVEHEKSLAKSAEIERELRSLVVAGSGVSVREIFLKPPMWIVKSTAGKAARSATRNKLLQEHPKLTTDAEGSRTA
jgi:fatty-acyl-CoA synthase